MIEIKYFCKHIIIKSNECWFGGVIVLLEFKNNKQNLIKAKLVERNDLYNAIYTCIILKIML